MTFSVTKTIIIKIKHNNTETLAATLVKHHYAICGRRQTISCPTEILLVEELRVTKQLSRLREEELFLKDAERYILEREEERAEFLQREVEFKRSCR